MAKIIRCVKFDLIDQAFALATAVKKVTLKIGVKQVLVQVKTIAKHQHKTLDSDKILGTIVFR
uniref:Uncharacterized protein n=1 Tax=Kalanchoe fedtschenkoi TaxID=63787 RepID=A0A7N0TPY8_KALFE